MKQIKDIEEVQHLLLNIAIEFDRICTQHQIPYFMLGGTMLGAVRHKGFIPWDDDMDFAVFFEDYPTLIPLLKKELPEKYRCITYQESETYRIPWIKLEDLSTRVIDKSLHLSDDKMPGLTIDIFPLVSCQQGACDEVVRKIQRWIKTKRTVYTYSKGTHSGIKNFAKNLISAAFPFSPNYINDKIMQLTASIPSGEDYTIPMDPNYPYRYFPREWFTPLTKFDFEDQAFYGITQYDSYLKTMYGNYMELPPLEKRRIHCDNVFRLE